MVELDDMINDVRPERELYVELGKALIHNQKFRRSIEVLTEALNTRGDDPPDWMIHFLIGTGHRNLNRTKEAFESFIEAARQNDESKHACFDKAGELISPSTVTELQPMLLSMKQNAADHGWSHDDVTAIDNLLARCSSVWQQKTEGISYESLSNVGAEPNTDIPDALYLVSQFKFKEALAKIDAALIKRPADAELLFTKIRILVEGQMDLRAAQALFDDADFGYTAKVSTDAIEQSLHELLTSVTANGNTYFFTAFIGALISMPVDTLEGWLAEAEKRGLQIEKDNPSIGLYIVHAALSAMRKDKDKSVYYLLETAKGYYFRADYKDAYYYFAQAIERDPNNTDAYRYQADTLYITSFITDPPYNDESTIHKAYQTWHAAPSGEVKQASDTWYYIIIARIHEVLHRFKPKDFADENWWAVLYLERALLHDAKNATNWTYLGRYLRSLQVELNAAVCFDKSASLTTPDQFLEEERITLQLNTGLYAEAEQTLLRWKNKPDEIGEFKSYHKAWLGFVYFHTQRRPEALQLFREAIVENHTDLFAYQMVMFCCWYDLQLEEAQTAARQILELKKRFTYLREAVTFSWAYFILDDVVAASKELDAQTSVSGAMNKEIFSRIQFDLYAGNWESVNTQVDFFLDVECNQRVLTEFIQSLDALVYQYSKVNPGYVEQIKQMQSAAETWKAHTKTKMEFLASKDISPLDEWERKRIEYHISKGSVAEKAMHAASARLLLEKGDRAAAYQRYSALLQDKDFPEASIACDRIAESVLDEAGETIQKLSFSEAITLLDAFQYYNTKHQALSLTLKGIAHFALNEPTKSLGEMREAFDMTRQGPGIGEGIWKQIASRIEVPGLSWSFVTFVYKSLADKTLHMDEEQRSLLLLNSLHAMSNTRSDLNSLTSPLIIEVSNNLIPPEAYDKSWYVITVLIPDMRKRLLEAYGVSPPFIRIRPNDALPQNAYLLLLDEIPYADGVVEGIQYETIIAHLERMLIQQLDCCLDMQSVLRWLDEYEADAQPDPSGVAKQRADAIAQNQEQLFALIAVLKNLVREHVSIRDKETIVSTFFNQYDAGDEASELTQTLRLALKPYLPFNIRPATPLQLKVETEQIVESSIRTDRGKVFLSMTEEKCQEVLSEIRELVKEAAEKETVVLLTRNNRIRFHLRLLTAFEFPNLLIGSQEEFTTPTKNEQ